MNATNALMVLISVFVFFSLIITFSGVRASLVFGTRPDGWSDTVAFSVFITFSTTTGVGLYWLEQKWLYADGLDPIYGWLVVWYFFLFVFGQRWFVRVLRERLQ